MRCGTWTVHIHTDVAMPKRSAPAAAPSDVVSQRLKVLADAVSSDDGRGATAAEAEKVARDALIKQVLAMPPHKCFSSAALKAFKIKHLAVMQRGMVPPASGGVLSGATGGVLSGGVLGGGAGLPKS